VFATAYVEGKRVAVIEHGHVRLAAVRQRLSELIDKAIEGPSRGLVKALLIGERSGIPDALQTAFNRAGVGHLLAISGLHVGIVAAAAFHGWCWLLAWFSPLLWPAWSRRAAALIAAVPVVFYGLLAGGSVATQRAVIMVMVFLLAVYANREQDPVNTLAAAAMLILALWPPALFSISFQLSFAAVFFILLGIRKNLQASNRNTEKFIAFVRVSVWALIGTLPLVAHYFHLVSWVGVLANLILVPIVGFGIVPAGLFCIVLGLVAPHLAEIGFHYLGFAAAWAIDLVQWFGSWPHAAVYTVTPSLIEILLYYAMVFWLVTFRRQRHANWALALILSVACMDAGYWSWQRFLRDDLRVSYIDVGQGNAALVQLPRGECMLIDGGGFGGSSAFDVGQQVVAPVLWHKKIATVETLVLSHPNSDHLNGLLFIAAHFHVKHVLMTHDPADLKSYERFKEIIGVRGIDAPAFDHLPRFLNRSGVQIRVLHPPRNFLATSALDRPPDLNNHSLVLRLSYGRVSFLFPGDIQRHAEAQMLQAPGAPLKSTVLLAPHHGSRTSSTPAFMQRVDPDVVVISAGAGRRFPHPLVMARYRRRGCRVFETARQGMVSMATDGSLLKIETFRQDTH
jgi:competence protein ComEC